MLEFWTNMDKNGHVFFKSMDGRMDTLVHIP